MDTYKPTKHHLLVWSGDELRAWLYLRGLRRRDLAALLYINSRNADRLLERGLTARELAILLHRATYYDPHARHKPLNPDKQRPTPEQVAEAKEKSTSLWKATTTDNFRPVYQRTSRFVTQRTSN